MWLMFSLWLLPSAYSQEALRWYPSNRFPEGDCARVHSPSQGNQYVEKLKPESCRPLKTSFLWISPQCYEVDEDTMGKQFGIKAAAEKCAPPGSLHAFDEKTQTCWLADPEGGLKFRAKIALDLCRPLESEIITKFVLTGKLGTCFETHAQLGDQRWNKKVDVTRCRPDKTWFAWVKSGDLKGDCYEIGQTAEAYMNRAVISNCRPEKLSYRFVRTGEIKGDCFEVDEETQGDKWALKVGPELCRPKE